MANYLKIGQKDMDKPFYFEVGDLSRRFTKEREFNGQKRTSYYWPMSQNGDYVWLETSESLNRKIEELGLSKGENIGVMFVNAGEKKFWKVSRLENNAPQEPKQEEEYPLPPEPDAVPGKVPGKSYTPDDRNDSIIRQVATKLAIKSFGTIQKWDDEVDFEASKRAESIYSIINNLGQHPVTKTFGSETPQKQIDDLPF